MRRLILFAALIAATGLFRRTPGGGSGGGSETPSGSNRPNSSSGPAPAGVTSLFNSTQKAIMAAKPRLAITATQHGTPSGSTPNSPTMTPPTIEESASTTEGFLPT
ncbi:hypothetical protein O1R50_23230 [Glycomyces luteolus]|uniref:Uncharacterized protein n=1 Tax=Glycomyces luteolus TaxID=2670330 RepID=A0A9X3PPC0_9ACTN|nr:hypothetical protein [Glycomyces luteolus]MDA1362555.1 hypothetical protein [Glycomyces luteolus]